MVGIHRERTKDTVRNKIECDVCMYVNVPFQEFYRKKLESMIQVWGFSNNNKYWGSMISRGCVCKLLIVCFDSFNMASEDWQLAWSLKACTILWTRCLSPTMACYFQFILNPSLFHNVTVIKEPMLNHNWYSMTCQRKPLIGSNK
jgi:hypothetical protein